MSSALVKATAHLPFNCYNRKMKEYWICKSSSFIIADIFVKNKIVL